MEKINIVPTDNEDGQPWDHTDWYYKLVERNETGDKRIGKLWRSRAWATREAKRLGYTEIVHWYRF